MVKTLGETTDKPKQINSITVYDDEPKSYFAIAYVAFNPSNPTEIEIISPLGKVYDNWFMKLVNRLRVYDKSFNEELQLFLMERTELFKDRIAYSPTIMPEMHVPEFYGSQIKPTTLP